MNLHFRSLLPMICASGAALGNPALAAKPLPVWTTSWFAPMVSVTPASAGQYEGQTIREIVHLSAGGQAFRLRISNQWGTGQLKVGAVHVAVAATHSRVQPGTDHTVTFSARNNLVVPMGATAVSDPIAVAVPGQVDLAVSIYVLQTNQISDHQGANQISYVQNGDLTAAAHFSDPSSIYDRPYLTGVDVLGSPLAQSVITLGDSITDGSGSDFNANDRWPDDLGRRLAAAYGNRVGVGNAGIGGNAIISRPAPTNPVATARIDQDVLSQPGRHWMILLEGINDIGNTFCCGPSPTASDLIAADHQLIETAHAMGLKVFGMTLLPFKGAGYFTSDGELKREALNAYIRTGGEFDAVFDTDLALRDPVQPLQLNPAFDSGDHLHPNAAGDQTIANTVDLSVFAKP